MGGFLYQSPGLQLTLIMYSFIIGISIGVVYSVFDTISIILNLHIVNKNRNTEIKLRNAKNKIIISKIFQFDFITLYMLNFQYLYIWLIV